MDYLLTSCLREGTSSLNKTSHETITMRALNLRPRGRGVEPHRHIYPSVVLVQPRKTRPCLTERLLMGCKELNQIKRNNYA